jgi:xanthine dehydrogenase accessory factor
MIEPVVSDEAVVLTPGGGRIGSLMGGAFDALLADEAARGIAAGHIATTSVGPLEAAVSGMAIGTRLRFVLLPVDRFPDETWSLLAARQSVTITIEHDNGLVTGVQVSVPGEAAVRGASVVEGDGVVATTYSPVTRLVIAGQGPMAEALADVARLLGWRVVADSRPDQVLGHTAGLSPMDAVVVMGHDVEQSSRNLMAALASDAGYIGALGSRKMQDDRATWLAYRDVTDFSRVHGPAGLDIGADTPHEIAVSVIAEALACVKGKL